MTGAADISRTCSRCSRVTTARGGRVPKFCAICGQRLPETAAVKYADRPPGFAPPAATASLILGLCAFIPMVGIFFAIGAVWLGTLANDQINASHGHLGGRGMAAVGTGLGLCAGMLWLAVCAGCRLF